MTLAPAPRQQDRGARRLRIEGAAVRPRCRPTSSGASAWASAVNGRSVGVHVSADHPAGRAGSTPARRNELLPAPDGPITARRRGRRNWRSSDSTSCSRPKKKRASVLREGQKAGIRALLGATRGVVLELERARQRACGWIPALRRAAQRPPEHRAPRSGRHTRRVLAQVRPQLLSAVLRAAGRRRHHLRQDDRGREHVGARIQRKSGRLFGRHVTGRPCNRSA